MSQATKPRPILAVDIGTTNSRAACMVNTKIEEARLLRGDLDTGRIQDFRFDRSGVSYARTELAWHQGRWLWGDEVQDNISEGLIRETDRIKMIKLGMESTSWTATIRKELAQKIESLPMMARIRTVDDLLTVYLTLFITEIMKKLNDRHRDQNEVDRFKLDELETIICVPAAWNFGTRHRMKKIAHNAGLTKVTFPISESDAAALFLKYDEPRQLGGSMEDLFSDPFLVMDGGGGTFVRA